MTAALAGSSHRWLCFTITATVRLALSCPSSSSPWRLSSAKRMDLGIRQGDMRSLPFAAAAFSHVYTFNSIFHLRKADTATAISEIRRVARPGGLIFANFLNQDDEGFGEGEALGSGQFLQEEYGEKVIHSFYLDDEPDAYFEGCQLLRKEKRLVGILHEGTWHRISTVDYIAKKN